MNSKMGKRLHRTQKSFNAGLGSHFQDDGVGATAYSQENLTSILNEPKPQRFVVKRYWTEDEVIFYILILF